MINTEDTAGVNFPLYAKIVGYLSEMEMVAALKKVGD